MKNFDEAGLANAAYADLGLMNRAYYQRSDHPSVMSADGLELQRARSQPGTEAHYSGRLGMGHYQYQGGYDQFYGDPRADYSQYGYYHASQMARGGLYTTPHIHQGYTQEDERMKLEQELAQAKTKIRSLEKQLVATSTTRDVRTQVLPGYPAPGYEDPDPIATSLAQLGIPGLGVSDYPSKFVPSSQMEHADLYRHTNGSPVLDYHKLVEQKQKLIIQVNYIEKTLTERRNTFTQQIQKLTRAVEDAKQHRARVAKQNWMLETQIIELGDDLASLREQLEREKHQNYLQTVGEDDEGNFHADSPPRFPPENVIIQNLIRAQVEFYFSDYNLKRDKRLLDQICSDRFGYLRVDTVMNLARVRQLSSHRGHVIAALQKSKFLALTQDDWVGRPNFQRPLEKQFPFRRTVYVFGLKSNDDEYVRNMLEPFGSIAKVQFDHGPDTLDRKIATQMFEAPRVYKLVDFSNPQVAFSYKKNPTVGGSKEYQCQWCSKTKSCGEGFYEGGGYRIFVCLQCAAAQAEKQAEEYRKQKDALRDETMATPEAIENLALRYLGERPPNYQNTITALAVFTSQRQASKCVYVRSRIAYEGCFTTHYHHYSKMKKEIALHMKFQYRVIGQTDQHKAPIVGRSQSLPQYRSFRTSSDSAIKLPPPSGAVNLPAGLPMGNPVLGTTQSENVVTHRHTPSNAHKQHKQHKQRDDDLMIEALLKGPMNTPQFNVGSISTDIDLPVADSSSVEDNASSPSPSDIPIGDLNFAMNTSIEQLDLGDAMAATEIEATKSDEVARKNVEATEVDAKVDEDTKKPGFHRMMTAPVRSASHTYIQSKVHDKLPRFEEHSEREVRSSKPNDDGSRWSRENWGKQRESLNVAKKEATHKQ